MLAVEPKATDSSIQRGSPADQPPVSLAGAAVLAAAFCSTPDVAAAIEAPPLIPHGLWLWLARCWWAKWLVLGSAPLLGLTLVVGTWWLAHRVVAPAKLAVQPASVEAAPASPATADRKPLPKTLPVRLDRRWLPDRTTLVFSVCGKHLAAQPQAAKLIAQADALWSPSIGAVLNSLGLTLDSVQRLTWASTDLAAWPQRSVVLLELAPGQDANALARNGEAADAGIANLVCRRMPGAPWSHPFVIVDHQTIVTGDEELLRGLGRRGEPHLESAPLDRLLGAFAPDADAMLLVDLAAARAAHRKLPTALLDVWPAGQRPWHVVWDVPEGLGCTLHWSEPLRSELALLCESETAADRVRAALDELLPAVKQLLPKQAAAVQESLRAGRLTVADAEPYKLLLEDATTALQAAHWQVADGTVWLRLNWGRAPLALATTALDSAAVLHAEWLAAALAVDRANHARLLAGLLGHAKAEGHFPAAAAGSALLPPETQLSWLAAMLPYYDHADWHRRLNFGYPWNDPQNRGVTQQPLPEVVNPALGPATTPAGFPVTHYVGVAGVGADAGRLKADDPRAGVFGYGRTTRPEDIARGASNTIAILGVADRCGAWGSGGDATVRPLTRAPYVNGPDGFGSGQPDGMVAGMADGSVRFISKDVDPRVVEQLATIHGRNDVTVAALNDKPAVAGAEPAAPAVAPPSPPAVVAAAEKPAAPAAKPPAPQPAAPAIDVDARLADAIPQLEFHDTPLGEAVELLTSMSTVPITIDPDALVEAGVSLRDPVSLDLTATTVGKVLETMLAGRKLTCVVENGRALITSPPENRNTLRSLRYTVSDLTGHDARALAELAGLIQKLVVPDSWQANGGRGSIQPQDGVLVIVQTGAVHYQIITFCEKLRTAQGLPTRSRFDRSLFALTTRSDRARAALGHEVTATFAQPTPLPEILAYLKRQADVDIFLDRPALAAAGMADVPRPTLKVTKRPLAAALAELLDPLALAYRVVDRRTIQVTTRKALAARLELEFYPIGDLLTKGQTASALSERIKSRVAGPTWSDAGGPGLIQFDAGSRCLIVLQSQPAQVALEALLAEKADR